MKVFSQLHIPPKHFYCSKCIFGPNSRQCHFIFHLWLVSKHFLKISLVPKLSMPQFFLWPIYASTFNSCPYLFAYSQVFDQCLTSISIAFSETISRLLVVGCFLIDKHTVEKCQTHLKSTQWRKASILISRLQPLLLAIWLLFD